MSEVGEVAKSSKRRLGAVLYNDFELLDAYGPLEMFGCLNDALEIAVIAEQKGPVKSSGGPCTLAEFDFTDAPALDLPFSLVRVCWMVCRPHPTRCSSLSLPRRVMPCSGGKPRAGWTPVSM